MDFDIEGIGCCLIGVIILGVVVILVTCVIVLFFFSAVKISDVSVS